PLPGPRLPASSAAHPQAGPVWPLRQLPRAVRSDLGRVPAAGQPGCALLPARGVAMTRTDYYHQPDAPRANSLVPGASAIVADIDGLNAHPSIRLRIDDYLKGECAAFIR